jgi:hypothetical protein
MRRTSPARKRPSKRRREFWVQGPDAALVVMLNGQPVEPAGYGKLSIEERAAVRMVGQLNTTLMERLPFKERVVTASRKCRKTTYTLVAHFFASAEQGAYLRARLPEVLSDGNGYWLYRRVVKPGDASVEAFCQTVEGDEVLMRLLREAEF